MFVSYTKLESITSLFYKLDKNERIAKHHLITSPPSKAPQKSL